MLINRAKQMRVEALSYFLFKSSFLLFVCHSKFEALPASSPNWNFLVPGSKHIFFHTNINCVAYTKYLSRLHFFSRGFDLWYSWLSFQDLFVCRWESLMEPPIKTNTKQKRGCWWRKFLIKTTFGQFSSSVVIYGRSPKIRELMNYPL